MNSFQKLLLATGMVASVHCAGGAASVEAIYSFGYNTNTSGAGPYELMVGADGDIYGAAGYGGAYGYGTVYKFTTNGILTALVSFDAVNGGVPAGKLTQDDGGVLYGTTQIAGFAESGTIFKLTTNGVLTHLALFGTNGLHGRSPFVGVVLGTNGLLYGTTFSGGTNFQGTFFVVSTNGAVISETPFNGTNGSQPLNLMRATDGNLYGITQRGGSNDYGTIFRATADGVVTSLLSFGETNGHFPSTALVEGPDGNFYGATATGGGSGFGTVYKLTPTGQLTLLHSFNVANGAGPSSLLQGTDGKLYGTTEHGGDGGNGTIFVVTTNGAFTSLYSFTNTFLEGSRPHGLVQGSDDALFGVTLSGGTNGNGTIFRITTNGAKATVFTFLRHVFTDGEFSRRPVQGPGGIFYGVTAHGGAHGLGTAYSMTTNGSHSILHSFTGDNDGEQPQSIVFARDGQLYGLTYLGGTNGAGTVFRMTTNGALTTLHEFSGLGSGGYPLTLVQGIDNDFYGATSSGGAFGHGTFFKITSAGAFTLLHSFNAEVDGTSPSSLVQRNDGNFYGVTQAGGTNDAGTVFKITPAGLATSLHQFNNDDGYDPACIMAGLDGNLYGATEHGGPAGSDGVIFKITTNGAFTILHSFTNEIDGFGPNDLVQGSDGNLYGVALAGGAFDFGTLFRIKTNGAFAALFSFDLMTDLGITPRYLMQAKDLSFYGVSTYGSLNDSGSFFRLTVPLDPSISSQPLSATNHAGATATFTVDADGVLPLKYQWRKNLVNLTNGVNVSGATSDTLSLSNIAAADVGSYSVVVTNTYGSVTSSNATLTVLPGLPQALDTTNLLWTTGGDAVWFGQPWTTHDGVDAAQSGVIFDREESWMQTTVNGPGVLTFWWKVSSESGYDFLSFYVNDQLTAFISGETDWQLQSFNLPAGSQTLLWDYEKDSSISLGTDRGWVDQVNFVPTPPPPPVFQPVVRTNNTLILNWSTAPGRMYQVLYTTNLSQPNWQSLGPPGTNGTASVLIGPDRARFYRVLLLP